jgi:23S rRNA (cytosine1962-C5)-methyltransferase
MWLNASAHYHRSSSGGGRWDEKVRLPERWNISYRELKFYIRPTSFKHTGLFPEQAVNWAWMMDKIRGAGRPIKVLNLFAYTGGATVACAAAGAEVCHVDAAKGMVQWAKENLQLSGLADRPARFITDDVFKFVQREQRRGNQYDAVIMDPPSYGRGPNGEMWKLENDLYPFLETCMSILSDKPLFFLINSYTTGLTATVLTNLLTMSMKRRYGGTITSGEIGLPITASGMRLPCGILGRWEE